MDLRVQRTRSSIKAAFLAIRAKKDLERITVTELAELAMINKATFYQHYQDIYDLSRQLEDALIDSTAAAVADPLMLVKDPTSAILQIYNTVREQPESYAILFSGSRKMYLLEKLEARFLEELTNAMPSGSMTPEKMVVISCLLEGCFYTFLNHRELSPDMLIRITGSLCEQVTSLYGLVPEKLK